MAMLPSQTPIVLNISEVTVVSDRKMPSARIKLLDDATGINAQSDVPAPG